MSIRQEILNIGESVIRALAEEKGLDSSVSAWVDLAHRLESAHQAGNLLPQDAEVATAVASGIGNLSTSLIDLKTQESSAITALSDQLLEFLTLDDAKFPSSHKLLLRTSKRSCRPATRRPPRSRSPSPPPRLASHASTAHDPRSLPLRHWFLDHLSFPYPSPAEKLSIAADCGITRAKVDSDMTNWRRRSGWTDMMVRFSSGDRDIMRTMIDRLVDSGEEAVRGVGEAVEGVRRYLMGEGPKVEIGWIDELPAVTARNPSTTPSTSTSPNLRKRRSSSEPDESDSESEEEVYNPKPTHSRSFTDHPRQMPHIPSISSLSTTSTFVNPNNADGQGGKRTVSGSSHYSYSTDSTFADIDDRHGVAPKFGVHSGMPCLSETEISSVQAPPAFTFTPVYASPYGLAPSSSQISRKRPADTPLSSENTKTTRLDHSYYHSSTSTYPSTPAEGSSTRPARIQNYNSTRALSPTSSHASHSSSGTEASVSSPSSVTDIETNYIPYPSFGNSGTILQSASGSFGPRQGSMSGLGSGSGSVQSQEQTQRRMSEHGMGMWSTSAPLPRAEYGVSDMKFSLPQGEYEFAPRLEGWTGQA